MEGSTRHFKVEEDSKYGIRVNILYIQYLFVIVTLWVDRKHEII